MEITIKRMHECTMEEVLESWNKGWEGYYFNMTMGYDQYFARMASEGLSIPLSLIAFAEGKPAGFLLNGIRNLDGKKVGWNGGTAVSPEYRRHGVGRKLMEAALDVYREEGCDMAILEAMSQNDRAIALYEQYGYETIDRLLLYVCESFGEGTFGLRDETPYAVRAVPLSEAGNLPFYKHWAAWQTHWLSDRGNGEALVVEDEEGNVVGYALCRRFYSLDGQLLAVVLTQCETLPDHPDADTILATALRDVFGPASARCRRSTLNLSAKHERLLRLLEQEGFKERDSQVYMLRGMEKE
ncbi:MAG: GNAT family N-acetyltransferase [Tumebacillaceae bacterium]